MKDLYHNLKVTQVLTPVVATTTQTSSAIDMQGFNSAVISVAVGQSGDTLSGTDYWTLTLQHSDDDSNYTDVANSDTLNGAGNFVVDSDSEDEMAYNFGYKGIKRYLKAIATPTGMHSNGTPLGILAMQSDAAYKPVI